MMTSPKISVNAMIKQKRSLSISETAAYACVSRATVENWISRRILPYEELPGRGSGAQRFRRIRVDDLQVFLDSHYHRSNRDHKEKSEDELILLPKNDTNN